VTRLERIANEVDVVGSRREGGRAEGDEPLVHTTARLAICEREEVGRPPAEEELEGNPAEEVAAGEYLSQRLDLPRAWTWYLGCIWLAITCPRGEARWREFLFLIRQLLRLGLK